MRRVLCGVLSAIVTVVVLFSVNDGLLRAALNMEESNRQWEERHRANPDAFPWPESKPTTMRERFNETVVNTTQSLINVKRRIDGDAPLAPDLPRQPNADPPKRPHREGGIQANPF